MKRLLVSLILALVLVLAVGGAAMASPVVNAGEGAFVLFGEYASDAYMFTTFQGYVVGAGFGFSKNLTIGVEMEFLPLWSIYGVYANLSLGSVLINCDVLLNDSSDIFVKAAGLYVFDVGSAQLAVGAGIFDAYGNTWYFVEGSANMPLGGNAALYGTVDYAIDGGDITYKAGVSFGL